MRHFYDDPDDAYWMKRKFSMRFQVLAPDKGKALLWEWEPAAQHLYGQQPRMYIHPESKYLLDPIPGDLLVTESCVGFLDSDGSILMDLDKNIRRTPKEYGIIQRVVERGGVVMPWPEEKT